MKKYEVIVEDNKADLLTALLQSLPYVKEIKEGDNIIDPYTLASEKALAEDWLSSEDDELQQLYKK